MAAGGPNPTRLYTRNGDRGETGLLGGARVAKDAPRVRVFGAYDELASQLGVAEALLTGAPEELALLRRLSHEVFLAMSEVAAPAGSPRVTHRIGARHVERLEAETNRLAGSLLPAHSFVLPGGTPAAAQIHVARSVARRAERELWTLHREEPQSAELLQWANRLSSFLFALALSVNRREGVAETAPDYSV